MDFEDIRTGNTVTIYDPADRGANGLTGKVSHEDGGWYLRGKDGDLTGPWDSQVLYPSWREAREAWKAQLEGRGFIPASICTCCLMILCNGDHSSCEGMCQSTQCDEGCDHGCRATFYYATLVDGYHMMPGGGFDENDSGELGFSTSSCDSCGNHLYGDRHEAWLEPPQS